MISRIWHGWNTPENADTYESLLFEEIFVGIKIMRFDSIDAIRMFAGDDYEACVVPPSARKILKRFDERSQHYEIKITEDGAHV